MAAATAGYEWNRSSPLRSSPDTASPMYPDRAIRPLPKRRLRDRMSPEQAEHIVYPSHPPASAPLFSFPYSSGDRSGRVLRHGESDHHACHCGHNHSEVESEEDEDELRAPMPSSPSYVYSHSHSHGHGHGRNAPGGKGGVHGGAYAKPASTSSSVDGYESFENTNNKKKRKIPNMGGMNTHHTNLSAEMASMGISHAHAHAHSHHDLQALDEGDGPGRYYGSAPSTPHHHVQQQPNSGSSNSGTGISGAGRGRFGRSGSGRSERRVLGNSTSLANAKASTKRPPDQQGIISTAIANAQATPPHAAGNENVSLLQQEAQKNSAIKTQFTFTCGSDSANKMAWPGQENGMPGAYPLPTAPPPPQARARPPVRSDNPPLSTHAAQPNPAMNGPHPPVAGKNAPAQRGPPPNQQQQQHQPPPPPKPRRSATKMYAYAARKRRQQQEYANLQNPPNPAWICEFCEYEDIFGRPPEALIRLYEKKDLADRRRLAEKRRLLAKARMKGRKGKKQNKKQNNANNAQANQNPPPGGYDRRPEDEALDGQEEYYDDEYDNLAPHHAPPTHCDHPGCASHPHHRAPMPQTDQGGTANANGA